MIVLRLLVLATLLGLSPAHARAGTPDAGIGADSAPDAQAAEPEIDERAPDPPATQPEIDERAPDPPATQPSSRGATSPATEPEYEVVVFGRRPLSRDRTQDETRVAGQRLRDSPRASTLEALSQHSAGVYVPARGALHGVASGATGGVRIRGLGGSPNSQVLIVEDGVPDYQGIFGHPIPDAYVPFLVDDVLLIKGGDSVLFGTNAMGGVVALRSRWRDGEGCELQSDTAYGSHATLRQTASLLGRFGAWDVAAAFHALATEGHRAGAGGNVTVGSTAARYRFSPALRLTIRNKLIHLTGADPGPVSHPHIDHWYDVWRDNASARLGWRKDAVRLDLTAHLNVGLHRLHDGFRSVDFVGGGTAELELELHRTTALLLGVAGDRVGGEVENRTTGLRPGVDGLTSLSLYDQLTFRPLDRLRFVLGSRALYSSGHGLVLLYKAGARWNVVEGLSVHTRVARNFRQPTLRELHLPFPTANPDLRPELSLSWDFGARYLSRHLELSCSGYRTEANDLIRYFGAWPSAEVVNVGRVVIRGLEASLGLRNLGPLSALVTAGWQDVGRYTRQNPDAKLNFTVEAGEDLGPHFVGGSVSGEWVRGLFMADYARQPIDDVFVMDLTLRYRYTSAGRGLTLEPYLFLRNLLDRRYAYVEGYAQPGFNALLGLKLGI